MPPWPKLCTNAFDTVFQPVGIMIGTSVGLGIAWTDSGWRNGGGTRVTRYNNHSLRSLQRGPVRKGAQQIQYLNRKSMPQPAKTENMSLHHQKRYKYSWTATTYACSPQAPATNTRGINKMNREQLRNNQKRQHCWFCWIFLHFAYLSIGGILHCCRHYK